MKKSILSILLLAMFFTISCGKGDKTKVKRIKKNNKNVNTEKIKTEKSNLPDLKDETIIMNEDVFGKIIELKGKSHPMDYIFRVSEIEMLLRGDLLILRTYNNKTPFIIFSLPDFKFVKGLGKFGEGPGEFRFPSFIDIKDNKSLFYIYEGVHEKVYSVDREFKITECNNIFPNSRRRFGGKQISGLSIDDFYYVDRVKGGKAIFHYKKNNGKIFTTLFKHLSFSKKYRSPFAYIGYFAVNSRKKRVVYAYKKFKRIIIINPENSKTRIIKFKKKILPDKKNILGPKNVTYYWGISAHSKYFYLLYSGRTPIQVGREFRTSNSYIFVEQFDWNGNPIRKFRLDHWGYFTVNDKEDMIYLTSVTDDPPFLTYALPPLKKGKK